ncbi:MAG TPA: YbaB/EbfC family nucleoid-associated protein [Firmicutes bacterium]|nr:YbaB/EbfC family nucleoid-associated protein [Bacillota bacterium]
MPNGGGMGKLMKQLQKAQARMAQLQEELAQKTIEFSSGGGAVRVKVNGKKELLSLDIDPEMLTEDNCDILEDAILVAVNEAFRQIDELVNSEISKLTGGMNLPPLGL